MQPGLYTRTEPLLLPYFPRLFYLGLRDQGFADDEIFAGMNLGVDQLYDERYRLSIEQHEHFILRMLELTDDPHFALRLVDLQEASGSNLPMLAAANSGQIAKALRVIARYNKVITRVFSVHFVEDSKSPRMDIAVHVEHDHVQYFAVSSLALFLSRFFSEALNGASVVSRLELSVAQPRGFESVRKQFPFPVGFGQSDTCIHLEGRHLEHAFGRADPQTLRLLTEMAEQQLREAEAETSLEGALRLLLVEQIAAPPTLNEAAGLLGLSSRSLRRKLAQGGTTYQRVLDSVRLAIAKRLLRESEAPVSSIAYELGFTHPSDFGRAFKKWSGQAPSLYRQQA